ncbi:effector-associated domain 2-containing protein [Streptomyces sp. NPDC002851]
MTATGVDPTRVVALVVGIESYAAGESWRLPGPAHDAARFHRWLRERGVPEENILLHLSPADGHDPGLPHKGADHALLRDALVHELRTLRGDFLWVWWGGHGVLDQDERIRLYSADATATDRRNIDLESARRRLASDALPGFGRQLWVVDACQTFDERHGFPDSLPTELLPTGVRQTVHEQALMLAATRGQRAVNDPERRTGVFSGIVLGVLGELDRPGSEVAPAAEPLFAAVRSRVEEAWRSGLTEQLPALVLNRPGAQDTLRPPHSAPAQRSLSPLTRIVNVVLEYPLANDPDERQTLVSLLPTEAVSRIRRHAVPRVDVVGIVRALSVRRGGLFALYEAVTTLDDSTDRAARLRAAIDAFAP